ncbi:MAG: hypothetical protein JJV98_21130 [Desulfosarcina sp.]|nr:hypothetical protein [Desulfobacterales bacterium]
MKWFIWLISLAWIAGGSLSILYTAKTREITGMLIERLGRVPLGVVTAVLGVLRIIASRGSLQAGFIVFLGLVALVKGGLSIWNPKGIYEKAVQWSLVEASDQTYRFMGIVMLIVGTAVFSWA